MIWKLLAWEADHAEGYTTKPTLVPSRALRRGKNVKKKKKKKERGRGIASLILFCSFNKGSISEKKKKKIVRTYNLPFLF